MFSFWTRIWSGTFRCLGAKFQMARMPLLMSRSHTPCACSAGTVMMPILICSRRQISPRRDRCMMGLPFLEVPMMASFSSKAATIFRPYSAKPGIAEQGPAQLARADEHGIVRVAVAENCSISAISAARL